MKVVLEWIRAIGLSIALLLGGLLALVAALFINLWQRFKNLLRGERRLYDTYLATIAANIALAVTPGPAAASALARWQSRLDDLRLDAHSEWQPVATRETQYSLAPLMAVEAEILVAMPDTVLSARFWAIEERFKRVVTPTMLGAWTDHYGKAYSSPSTFTPDQMREEACTLLARIHNTYLCNIAREQAVRALKLFILLTVLTGIVVATAIGHNTFPLVEGPASFNPAQRAGLALLFSAGMIGAGVSVIRRLSSAVNGDILANDAMMELTGLNLGHAGIGIGLLLGGVFALVLYFILWAGGSVATSLGTVGQTLIPTFPANGGQAVCTPVTATAHTLAKQVCGTEAIVKGLGLDNAASLARLLVLCFLAGFSERLVPDVLDRLAGQNDQTKSK
jgi:hypothetical protein